jgi:hypothetical protein
LKFIERFFWASDPTVSLANNVKYIILILLGMTNFERIWSQLLFTDSQKLAVGQRMNQALRNVAAEPDSDFHFGFGSQRCSFYPTVGTRR